MLEELVGSCPAKPETVPVKVESSFRVPAAPAVKLTLAADEPSKSTSPPSIVVDTAPTLPLTMSALPRPFDISVLVVLVVLMVLLLMLSVLSELASTVPLPVTVRFESELGPARNGFGNAAGAER